MKLSEILKDWPEKRISLYPPDEIDTINFSKRDRDIYNTALTSCDREIDREALADKIMEINFESYGFSHEEVAYKTADKIISTMPTWLRKVGKNE